MSKIFLAFYSGVNDEHNELAIPCFYESFINGLIKYGNKVFAHVSKKFIFSEKQIPQNLLHEIEKFNPDLIILFNNNFYDISEKFDCPIIIFDVDSPLYYSNQTNLLKKPNRYKYIVTQEEVKKIIEDKYKVSQKNILIAPFFTEIKNEKLAIKHNISFIGTKFGSGIKINPFNKFMQNNPSYEEIFLYKQLINQLYKKPLIDKNSLFKSFNINSTKIKNNFNIGEILCCLSDFNRVKTLSNISDLGLTVYGTRSWITDNYNEPYLVLNYNCLPIYSLKQNQFVYNSSKIGININHMQAIDGFSWRVCDIMASNACLVTEYKPNIKKYFSRIHLPTFNNPYEARELCIKILKEENMREDIVQSSNEIIDKEFRFINFKSRIEYFCNISLSGNDAGAKIALDKNYLDKSIDCTTRKTNIFKYASKQWMKNTKNNIRYKIWKHLDHKLRKKGLIK